MTPLSSVVVSPDERNQMDLSRKQQMKELLHMADTQLFSNTRHHTYKDHMHNIYRYSSI